MAQYINKDILIEEIEKLVDKDIYSNEYDHGYHDGNNNVLYALKKKINTFEVINPYEKIVQYDSIKAGIQAHAETYSFNIESKLFNQLTKEQQKLWREEIEQACISGGEVGIELANDKRYKENLEMKEMNLNDHQITDIIQNIFPTNQFIESETLLLDKEEAIIFAKHFFNLGFKDNKMYNQK